MFSLLLNLRLSCLFALLSLLILASATCPEDAPVMPQLLSRIETMLLENSIQEAFPGQLYTNITRELNEMGFQESVCSYFQYYQRFYWHMRHLSLQNNTERAANTTLLAFLLKKSTKTSCSNFKSACAGAQVCSNLDCDINSIATLCLGLPAKRELINFLEPQLDPPTQRSRPMLIQLWMQLNLSDRNLRDGLFDSLASVLEDAAFIQCTAPSNSTATVSQIHCQFRRF